MSIKAIRTLPISATPASASDGERKATRPRTGSASDPLLAGRVQVRHARGTKAPRMSSPAGLAKARAVQAANAAAAVCREVVDGRLKLNDNYPRGVLKAAATAAASALMRWREGDMT